MGTKEVHINRAVSMRGDGHVDPVAIIIDGDRIRDLVGKVASEVWQREVHEVYIEEAILIVDALATSLPGGTMDQVIALLLQRRASLFIVPLFTAEEKGL
jgi:hypothetical protein